VSADYSEILHLFVVCHVSADCSETMRPTRQLHNFKAISLPISCSSNKQYVCLFCSVAAALAIPKATSHHYIQSDNFTFVFHEYVCVCFKLQM
jgi:hypothetical protein